MSDVVKPENLAVGRIEERSAELPLVLRLLIDGLRVTLGLDEDALRAERELLGLADTKAAATVEKGVVGGADGRLELLNSETIACRT
jgi:hypothetical protein